MYEVVLLREFSSTLETSLSLQEYQQDECKSYCPLFKVPEWLIVAIKEYLFMNEISSSIVMGTVRYRPGWVWVKVAKVSSSTSWPS